MLRTLSISIFLLFFGFFGKSQSVSFSYLIPKNGAFAAPISPISIRGVGFGEIAGIESGFSLYSLPGLPIDNLPFASNKPMLGSSWSVLVPIQAFLSLDSKKTNVKFLAGGLGMINLFHRLNEGNIDRTIAAYEGWDVATSNFDDDYKLGTGLMGGIAFEFKVRRDFSIITEFQYIRAKSEITIGGTYAGGNMNGTISEKTLEATTADVALEGLEISLGVKF